MGKIDAKHSTLIKDIYNSKEYKAISGENVQDLCLALQSESEDAHKLEKEKIQKY